MAKFQLGDKTYVTSKNLQDGFFITGDPGQGKSVVLTQFALTAIKNKQTGLLIDPYGDLVQDIKKQLESKEAKQQTAFVSLNLSQKKLDSLLKNKFVIAAGKLFTEGHHKTAEKQTKLLTQFYKKSRRNQWLIVDEAFGMTDKAVFNKFIKNKQSGIYSVLSDNNFAFLSTKERTTFAKHIKNLIIFKVRSMNAMALAKERKILDADAIKTIKQFNFQLVMGNRLINDKGLYPLEKI